MTVVVDLSKEAAERATVIKCGMAWAGTPYHHEAKIRSVGCDCATLLIGIFEDAGLVSGITPEHYPEDFMLHRSEERYLLAVALHAGELPAGELPRPGDLALWKFGRCFSHGALVVAWPTILHAVKGRNVFLEDAEKNSELRYRERKFFSYWRRQLASN